MPLRDKSYRSQDLLPCPCLSVKQPCKHLNTWIICFHHLYTVLSTCSSSMLQTQFITSVESKISKKVWPTWPLLGPQHSKACRWGTLRRLRIPEQTRSGLTFKTSEVSWKLEEIFKRKVMFVEHLFFLPEPKETRSRAPGLQALPAALRRQALQQPGERLGFGAK